jgi:hypothetical protein
MAGSGAVVGDSGHSGDGDVLLLMMMITMMVAIVFFFGT